MRIALFGHPVGHSRSKDLFDALAREGGPVLAYEPVDVPRGALAGALARLRGGEWDGANVTVPHKIDAAAAVRVTDTLAAAAGAVNVLVREPSGRLYGANTDGPGLLDALVDLPEFHARSGAKVVVLGSGGAARGAVAALRDREAEVTVVSRDPARARDWCEALGVATIGWSELATFRALPEALIVQATSLGMSPNADAAPSFPFDRLRAGQPVIDLVYNPWETRFLREVRARGAAGLNGWPMLVAQAARALALWGLPEATPLFETAALRLEPRDPQGP